MSDSNFMVSFGICARCYTNPVFSKRMCRGCLVQRRRAARQVQGTKPWKAGRPGRPPLETRTAESVPA